MVFSVAIGKVKRRRERKLGKLSYGFVTQLVEYHPFKMGVAGPIPAKSTKLYACVVEIGIAHFIKIRVEPSLPKFG